jgi:hypothetical protein
VRHWQQKKQEERWRGGWGSGTGQRRRWRLGRTRRKGRAGGGAGRRGRGEEDEARGGVRPVVADEEGDRDSDGEGGGAEEVRATEQVGAEGLHGCLPVPREAVGVLCVVPGAGTMRMRWDRSRGKSISNRASSVYLIFR